MADNNDIPAYPYMFDPSQMSNKYSPYAGVALPFMGGYSAAAGPPTDAHGNPIQSYQNTQAAHDAWAAANPAPQAPPVTLNSNSNLPPLGSQARAMYDAGYGDWSQLDPSMGRSSIPGQANGANNSGGYGAGISGQYSGGFGGSQPYTAYNPRLPQAAAAKPQAAAAPTNPYDMNQAYLTALANPGRVTTPGATVAQSTPPSAQSGVLQQFLQNWGGNSKGAGNYDNSGFINALRGMV